MSTEKQQKPTIRRPWTRTRQYVDLTGQESKVDTSHGNDTNINNIVARFARTGQLPKCDETPQYADVTGLQQDLTEIIQRGREAQKELLEHQSKQAALHAQRLEDDARRLAEYDARMASEKTQTQPSQSPT